MVVGSELRWWWELSLRGESASRAVNEGRSSSYWLLTWDILSRGRGLAWAWEGESRARVGVSWWVVEGKPTMFGAEVGVGGGGSRGTEMGTGSSGVLIMCTCLTCYNNPLVFSVLCNCI